jgi:ornithine cyclodeaminase
VRREHQPFNAEGDPAVTRILKRAAIEQAIAGLDLIPLIEAGFAAYSAGRCNIPPVGELVMEKGEVHIKYGCITGDDYYVVKIASGFYGNPSLGLASGNGLMLVFNQNTGSLKTVLLDDGLLTDVRTAVAGAVAAKYLAPSRIERIGVIGTGVQARLQLEYLMPITPCRNIVACGRTPERLDAYRRDMEAKGFSVETTSDPSAVAARCQLIVTTTPSAVPLLRADDIRPGTHISAIGSDTPHKQELAADILSRAARLVVDSIPQCRLRGEVHKALEARAITEAKIEEIGNIILGKRPSRTADDEITVFDSTGVAVQDIQIAKAVAQAALPT